MEEKQAGTYTPNKEYIQDHQGVCQQHAATGTVALECQIVFKTISLKYRNIHSQARIASRIHDNLGSFVEHCQVRSPDNP